MMINHVKNNVLRSKKWEFNSEENKTNRHTQKKKSGFANQTCGFCYRDRYGDVTDKHWTLANKKRTHDQLINPREQVRVFSFHQAKIIVCTERNGRVRHALYTDEFAGLLSGIFETGDQETSGNHVSSSAKILNVRPSEPTLSRPSYSNQFRETSTPQNWRFMRARKNVRRRRRIHYLRLLHF